MTTIDRVAAGTRYAVERTLGGGGMGDVKPANLLVRKDGVLKGAGIWLLVATAAVAAITGVGLALLDLGGDSTQTRESPPTVAPPARGTSAADEARNLSEWLRRHSR